MSPELQQQNFIRYQQVTLSVGGTDPGFGGITAAGPAHGGIDLSRACVVTPPARVRTVSRWRAGKSASNGSRF